MKKVFFNDRFIAFSDKDSDFANEKNQCLLQNNIDLPKILNDFLHHSRENYLCVLCKNEDETFVDFCNLFVMIFAGGGLVKNSQGDMLMIFRYNHWDLPKGKQEKDEKIDRTALREVEEECGVHNLQLGRFITETYHCYMFEGKLTMKRTFWYEMFCNETNLVPQTEEDISIATFVPLAQIAEKLENTYASILEVFKAEKII